MGSNPAAQLLLKERRYNEALGVYDLALAATPDHLDGLMGRADCYRHLKDFARAEADLDHLLSLDPSYIDAYRLRAFVYNKENDHARANRDLTTLLEKVPDDFDALHFRGITLAKLGEYDAAVDDLTAAIRIEPSSAMAHRSRGLAYGHVKKYALALADFDRALELNPEEIYPVIRDRGCIHVHLHAFQEAVDDLTTAIQIEPADTEAYRNRALANYCLGRYIECIDDARVALQHNPCDSQALLDIAKANFKMNKLTDAVPYLIDAVVIDPIHAPAVKKLLKKLLLNSQFEQQIPTINRRGSLGASSRLPPMPDPPEKPTEQIDEENCKETHDDDYAERKRKAMLKQMLATKRLAEFRRHGHEKDNLKKKVEERQALTEREVQRRADQAIKLKHEIERQFAKVQKEKEDVNEEVEKEVEAWKISLRMRPENRFRLMAINLPRILRSAAFSELISICALFEDGFSRAKAYREIARLIHPDKLDKTLSAKEQCLANAVWCALSDAYSTDLYPSANKS